MTTSTATKYEVKNVKTSMGHDGDPSGSMSCTLYKDGKKLGTIVDDSWGGGLQYHMDGKAEQEFEDFCKALPQYKCEFDGGMMDMNGDIYIDELVSDYEEKKQFKRLCKTKIVWKCTDQKEGEFWSMKGTYNDKAKAYLAKKYDNIEFIYNERYI